MSSAPRPAAPPFTIGSMLRSAWTELIDEVFEQLAAAGFEDLRPLHRPILRDLLTSNLRPSELAARLGLSKQAANDLVREFEAKGYITLQPDPDDGRAKRIVATDRGRQASETAQEASNAVGRRWSELVGEERYAVFEEVLHTIVATTPRPLARGHEHRGWHRDRIASIMDGDQPVGLKPQGLPDRVDGW